jgi:hypothetical protein
VLFADISAASNPHQSSPVADHPSIFLNLMIDVASPFLDVSSLYVSFPASSHAFFMSSLSFFQMVLQSVSNLTYPKEKMDVNIVLLYGPSASRYRSIVSNWTREVGVSFLVF